MKRMKKLIAVLLTATMALGLAACGGSSSTAAGVDDGSFIQNCYEGILSFIDSRGGIDTVTDIMEPTGDPAAAVQAVADIVADYDVIVTPGFQFAGISTLAEENPDTKFILVDSFATDAEGNTIELDNLYAMMFSEQEGGFLAGMAAALSTQTGKVASVHGIAYESARLRRHRYHRRQCGRQLRGQLRRPRHRQDHCRNPHQRGRGRAVPRCRRFR